jgi:MFS family permease
VTQTAPKPARPGLRSAAAALHIRDFRVFWIGALISNTGAWMQNVTVPFVVFQITDSAAWVGAAGFAQFIPAWLMGPLGGAIADRFPRRRVLIVTASFQALVAGLLALAWAADVRTVWPYLVLVAISGSWGGINIASWQAFVSELVPKEHLLNGITLNSAQFNASKAFGPALGGVVLATLGAGWGFGLNAISFVAVIVALVMIRARPAASSVRGGRPHVIAETREAARHARAQPGVITCILVVMALGFFGSPVFSLIVVFTHDVFHVGDTAYGLLSAAQGIGAILGAPLIAGPGTALRRSRLVAISMLVYGGALIVFALSPTYVLALLPMLVAGACYLALASSLNTSIQLQVHESMRGRILALYVMGLTLSVPIGNLAQGYLAEHIGPRATVAGAGLCFLAVWVVLQLRNRFALLDAERRDEQDERDAEQDDLPPLPTPGLAGEPSEVEQLPG